MDRKLAVVFSTPPPSFLIRSPPPPAHKKHKSFYPDTVRDSQPFPDAIPPLFPSFSQANKKAVIDMRHNIIQKHAPKSNRLLMTAEQQQLMLQFHWQKGFVPVQSHTNLSTEITAKAEMD